MIYTVAQLDAMPLEVVLGVDRDDTIIDFQKEFWKPKWIEVAGYWMEDPDSFHDIAVEGFRGWVDRTAMEIYNNLPRKPSVL